MLRAIYAPFGISWIDGLDSFDSISANYCLVKRDSLLMPKIQILNDQAIESVRNEIIVKKNDELMKFFLQVTDRMTILRKHYAE